MKTQLISTEPREAAKGELPAWHTEGLAAPRLARIESTTGIQMLRPYFTLTLATLLALALVACRPGVPTPRAEPSMAAIAQVSPSAPPATTITTRTWAPPTAAPEPSLTLGPEPTAPPRLDKREPTLQELSDFLALLSPSFYGFDSSLVLEEEDISGDGLPDIVGYENYGPYQGPLAVALVYQDVSGDGEPDLVSYGYFGLVVLLWDQDQYSVPFTIPAGWSRGGGPDVTVGFEDWIGDSIPELVVDTSLVGGGTGLWITYVERVLVRCQDAGCSVIWAGAYSRKTDDLNTGGIADYTIDMRLTRGPGQEPAIRVVDQGFSIYCCLDYGGPDYPFDSLNIYTSTLKLYTWNGSAFAPAGEQIVSRQKIIRSQSVLYAEDAAGHQASLTWADNHAAGNANEYCRLYLDGQPTGAYFGCRHKFTTVEWKDITRDAQNELVVTTYSAGYPYGGPEIDAGSGNGTLSPETCAHQRIVAYQWTGDGFRAIANVAGCVIDADLYGVRLADYDADGQVEILAAPVYLEQETGSEYLANRAYKWDGSEFVLWSEVPYP